MTNIQYFDNCGNSTGTTATSLRAIANILELPDAAVGDVNIFGEAETEQSIASAKEHQFFIASKIFASISQKQ